MIFDDFFCDLNDLIMVFTCFLHSVALSGEFWIKLYGLVFFTRLITVNSKQSLQLIVFIITPVKDTEIFTGNKSLVQSQRISYVDYIMLYFSSLSHVLLKGRFLSCCSRVLSQLNLNVSS